MNKIFYTLFLSLLFVSCSTNDADELMEEVKVVVEEVVEEGSQTSSFKGEFVSRAHPTMGMVTVNDEISELYFKEFKTDDGPKLLVYLSNDIVSTQYVDLGDLQGVSGDFTYTIPTGTDLNKFKYVNIWCIDFSVSFGTAELKMQ